MLSIGGVLYVSLLLVNSVAILNHERFLVPLGFHAGHSATQQQYDPYAAPGQNDGPTVKARAVALVGAVRTLMRSQS